MNFIPFIVLCILCQLAVATADALQQIPQKKSGVWGVIQKKATPILRTMKPQRIERAGPVCGNGRLEAGEECDDGNVASGDGCNATCATEAPVSTSPEQEPPPPPPVGEPVPTGILPWTNSFVPCQPTAGASACFSRNEAGGYNSTYRTTVGITYQPRENHMVF